MKSTINCPVCGRLDIEENRCPNCETDLSILKMLYELPIIQDKKLNIPLAILLISSSLLASFVLGVAIANQINNTNKIQTILQKPFVKTVHETAPCIKGFYYQVRSGDSLSLIARRFYGKDSDYLLIFKANPQLKNRKNNIEIGEIILIPNNIKEYTCEFISNYPEIKKNQQIIKRD
jgi:LysM repeat protein